MNNPNLSNIIVGLMLFSIVGCGYSPLDQELAADELAGTYLPGHSVIVTAKKVYTVNDLRRLHITLSADQIAEAVLPDGWRKPMTGNETGTVEPYTGTWSVEKNSDGKQALALKLVNIQTNEKQGFSLALAEHGDSAIIGMNVITEATMWFGFSDTHIEKDIWFRKKSDELVAYLEKNISEDNCKQE